MWVFKSELKKEFLQGRTIKYVAENLLKTSPIYLVNLLNGKQGCSTQMAVKVVKQTVNQDVKYYFTKTR